MKGQAVAGKRISLWWDRANTPPELHSLLEALAGHYPIHEGRKTGAVKLVFVSRSDGPLEVAQESNAAAIVYSKPFHAARGIGALLAGLVGPPSDVPPFRRQLNESPPSVAPTSATPSDVPPFRREMKEQLPFDTFGIMLDCSRNAVMTVPHFQAWLRQLALLGYNMAMLYTEDTYQLPGESYFGYLRGRYSLQELKQIDDYAASVGIEMIGCIQTLGHLEQILKWPAYREVRDTSSVLLVDEPKTYELIDKMAASYAACYRTRRIHIGMDETHDLGRGKFMDRFGYQRGYDIFNRHLAKVIEICRRHGLKPMIWSDMYFRMGSKSGGYYDADCRIPEDVKAAIPGDAQLVYWDYYHDDERFYTDWIGRHRELGFEPVMASGVWTWGVLWHDAATTRRCATPCVQASRKAGLKELFFTMWGDDGACCEFDSALAGLAYAAELAWAGEACNEQDAASRFAAICGADYAAAMAAGELNLKGGSAILWDDPLLGIYYKHRRAAQESFWPEALAHYRQVKAALAALAKKTAPIDFAHGYNLACVLAEKIELKLELERAYAARDLAAMAALVRRIPGTVKLLDNLLASFRRQWYRRNKPQGFEAIQIRLAGSKQRYIELRQRLSELLAGKVQAIPELDEQPGGGGSGGNWRQLASGSSSI